MATQDSTTQDTVTPATRRGVKTIEFVVVETPNIDTVCYRGSASISDLGRISQADVFDQIKNPNGLQRDLSPRHASDAYNYVNKDADPEFPRAFPEVILNVRDEHVLEVEPMSLGRVKRIKAFRFLFDLDAIEEDVALGRIAVSRVDGNHRLFYANGNGRRDALDESIPFQIHVGLSPEQEANLFTDVNANQKGLNSSHLHVLRSRLTPEEQEIREHPERVFARRLSEDPDSAWNALVFMGGSRKGARAEGIKQPVSFVTLETGVKRTLAKSQYIHDLTQPDAQYILLRNFWDAVKAVFVDEWEKPDEYLLLKNLGVISLSTAGGTVIDRCMARGEVGVEDMKAYLTQMHDKFDWSKDATGERSLAGMSGNRAAVLIAGELVADLVDPGESRAVASLQERLLKAAGDVVANLPDHKAENEAWRESPEVDDLEAAGVKRSVVS